MPDIADAIASARSLNRAIEHMSLGLESLGDDYGDALLTVSRAVESQLLCALAKCRSPKSSSIHGLALAGFLAVDGLASAL